MNGFDDELDGDATQIVAGWLAALNAALQAGDAVPLTAFFRTEADWRDVVALTGTIETVGDRAEIGRRLGAATAATGARGFAIDPRKTRSRARHRRDQRTTPARHPSAGRAAG